MQRPWDDVGGGDEGMKRNSKNPMNLTCECDDCGELLTVRVQISPTEIVLRITPCQRCMEDEGPED